MRYFVNPLSCVNKVFIRFNYLAKVLVIAVVLTGLAFHDAKAQSVSITSPANGSSYNVGDIIPVTATATTTFLGSLDKVVFTLGSVTQTDFSGPYNVSLNTSTLAAGSYTLTVTNYYTPFLGFQNTISATITITLNGAPVITYTTPQVYTVGTPITTLTPANTGSAAGTFGFGTATALTGATLNNPRGIAMDALGNIYVTNSGNNTISKYNSSGTYVSTFGSGATMSFPKDLVFDSSGNAYVLNLGATAGTGTVYKYNSSGVYQSTILSGLNYALGLTIDASDNIYVADQGAVTVKKYSTSGALLLSLPTTNFSTPLGVAVDASGNIYVLNNGTGNVTKYNSAGTFLSTFLTGYTSAQAITIDGAGNIYVGDNAVTNTVYVYNQSGTLLTSKAVTDPEGIAVDTKGTMFTSSYFSNQMNKYTPTGGYYLNKALPAGLNFNSSTGSISGTPTAAKAATVYTVTAYNTLGSGSATLSITVNSPATYSNYAFQDGIMLNTTSLGITSNLTNFPALLSIQDNDLIISGTCADKVQNPNGPNYDFAFVSGGSELYYQVESYNQTTGTLLVWVQIPSLT
ncbi:MAG: Ig-like domain-containing protein, partial [Mucilaginibacter sp.]